MSRPNASIQQFLTDIRRTLDRMGINPLLALGLVILCIISPRFVILIAIGYGVYWYGRNIGFGSRRGGRGVRRRRF